jgi:DNA repair exonuclease SbcCD nuclease subunit
VVTLTSTKTDIRFIHLADTHLGLNWPPIGRKTEIQIPIYGRAFGTIIEAAVTNQVDFVVHGGDLVDRPRPPTAAWNRILEELPKLKKAGIPFFVTPGSHDKPESYFDKAGGDILQLLEKKLSLVQRVDSDAEPVKFETKSGKPIIIYGLGDHGTNQEEELLKLKKIMNQGPEFKILIMHGSVTSQPNLAGPTAKAETVNELFSQGLVDYVALGHNHARWEHQQTHIYNPGSPEITSFADAPTISYTSDENTTQEDSRQNPQHGFYNVEVTGEITKAKFISTQTRDIKNIRITFKNAKSTHVTQATKNLIMKNLSTQAIIRPVLTGTLHPSSSRAEIDTHDILSLRENILYLDYPLMSFENAGGQIQFSKTSDLESAFQTYFTSLGTESPQALSNLAMKILQVYEKKSKTAHQEAFEIIDGWKTR